MLIVISDVKGQPIKRSIIRVRFLSVMKNEMFGNKVSGNRMELHTGQGAKGQVNNTGNPIPRVYGKIKGNGS